MPLFDRRGLDGRPVADLANTTALRSQSPARNKGPTYHAFLAREDRGIGGLCDIVNRLRGSKVISFTSLGARWGFL